MLPIFRETNELDKFGVSVCLRVGAWVCVWVGGCMHACGCVHINESVRVSEKLLECEWVHLRESLFVCLSICIRACMCA